MWKLAKVRVTVRFRLKKWPQMIILDMSSIIPIFALLKNYNILGLLYSVFSHTYYKVLQKIQINLFLFCLGWSSRFGQQWNCRGTAKVCYFWGCCFLTFHEQKKIFWKYCSFRTKKLHNLLAKHNYQIWKELNIDPYFPHSNLQLHSFYANIWDYLYLNGNFTQVSYVHTLLSIDCNLTSTRINVDISISFWYNMGWNSWRIAFSYL